MFIQNSDSDKSLENDRWKKGKFIKAFSKGINWREKKETEYWIRKSTF
jgi:hypothetical protein